MPRQVDHDAYRADLVLRTTALFAKSGYSALSMRNIAEHLGVSTGTLYHYFPNKEALFEGVVEDVSKRDVGDLRGAMPEGLDAKAKAQLVMGYVESMESHYLQQNLVMIEWSRDKPSARDRTFNKASARYQKAAAELLAVDMACARAILIFIKGLILQRLYDGARTQFDEQVPYLEALIRMGALEKDNDDRQPLRHKKATRSPRAAVSRPDLGREA